MTETNIAHKILDVTNRMAGIRDSLEPITLGTIKKGRNIDRYAIFPEYRKTTLKDARDIAGWVIKNLNECINELDDYATEYLRDNIFE